VVTAIPGFVRPIVCPRGDWNYRELVEGGATVGLIWALVIHAIWPALELTLHGLTPLAIVSAMTFGNIAMLFALGARIFIVPGGGADHAVRGVVALCAMGSMSMMMWAACVVLLHDAGLL
jgi:hypothetical protein